MWETSSVNSSNGSNQRDFSSVKSEKPEKPHRCLSFLTLLISCIICFFIIYELFYKWQINPAVSKINQETSIYDIPFPAVTICPEVKVLKRFINFKETYWDWTFSGNATRNESKFMEALAQVCDSDLFDGFGENQAIKSGLKEQEIVAILDQISPPMEYTFIDCKLSKATAPCEGYFSEVITEEGKCFTFNVLNSSELLKDEK
jgi:amiloride-sensitive sodium channel